MPKMTETQQQRRGYPFTSIPSTSVRLGRLWVDYAEANDMPMQRRIGETNRYVWLEQTPHQWYSAMLYVHWYIVGHSTGWNTKRSADTKRIIGAAKRAYRQLVRQSPEEWHNWLKDEYWGYEPVSPQESFTTWHVKFSKNRADLGNISCPHMPILANPEDVLLKGASMSGMPIAYNPIRDPERDSCWGLAWRVWCVDINTPGWMVEYVAQVVPFITLMYHREETICRRSGCSLCGQEISG